MDGKKLDIFYFSGTHWDREWYQTLYGFRYRLVEMFEKLEYILDNDKDYGAFHFDGQTVVLEDILEVLPEKRSKLERYIKDKKIIIGPWYVMPDEFLVSGESLIRNLMTGHKISKDFGAEPFKYGYICDIFGHIAQMPQIFNGFSIKYSLLGRGTNEKDPAYFIWRSPDGSECLNYKLSPHNGYSMFNLETYGKFEDGSASNKALADAIKVCIDSEIERAELPVVVIMDALDHSVPCEYTTDYLRLIKEMYPNAVIHHENLCRQGEMLEQYRDRLPVITGELNKTAEFSHMYLRLITNTVSSRYPLKQANDKCENTLEKTIEPLTVISNLQGYRIKRKYIEIAYKYLLKNQPHDSICGCSVDRVHKDMEFRFDQTLSLCDTIIENYVHYINENAAAEKNESREYALRICNTLLFDIDKVITVDIDFPTDFEARYSEPLDFEEINSFKIIDEQGREVPYSISGIKRGIFRRMFESKGGQYDVHTVSFRAELKAMGVTEYRIVPSELPVRYFKTLSAGADYAENELIRMQIEKDGSITVFDKLSNKKYSGLCNLADDGEIGDGYFHTNPVNDRQIFSSNGACRIERSECSAVRCVFKISRILYLPKCIVKDVHGISRSNEYVETRADMYVTLTEGSRYVSVRLNIENNAKDHRVRLQIPTYTPGEKYFAGQAFYFCERDKGLAEETQSWSERELKEKSMNGIVGKRDDTGDGIVFISSSGLHECSCGNDEKNTINVTLFRSFSNTVLTSGEEEGQLLRNLDYEFTLMPLDSNVGYDEILKIRDSFAAVPVSILLKNSGSMETKSYFRLTGKNIVSSIVKTAEDGKGVIIRVYNASDSMSGGRVESLFDIKNVSIVNLNEEYAGEVESEKNSFDFELSPWRIATFKIEL